MNTTPILQVNKVTFHYPEKTLFDTLSVDIYHGLTILTGGDGCGKSSFLNILAGELPILHGDVAINNVSLKAGRLEYQKNIFWVDTKKQIFDQFIVNDLLSTLSIAHQNFDQDLLVAAVNGLGLLPHLDKQFFMLSTGTKRKVWLAAALSARQPVTLLDDAFAGVDKLSIQFFTTTLNQLLSLRNQSWVISTYHELDAIHPTKIIDLGS